jgi:phosphatidylglycerol:prolipoprotein diacylglycerol transferase
LNSSEYYLVNFDPVAISLGPLQVHWYGIMYLLAFLSFWWLQSRIAEQRPWWGWTREAVGDFMFYGMLGVILGGRLGYVVFYGLDSLFSDPLYLFRIWDGGMSFHGGMLGVAAAAAWFAWKTGRGFWQVVDFVAPVVPLGLALGRIGNFIGGELWGRLGDVPWAMIFPASLPDGSAPGGLLAAWQAGLLDEFARHPSQLYQASLEGLALFGLMLWYSARPRPRGAVTGFFLLGYGSFRLLVEFFRQPDVQLGYLAGGWLTMGMLLSLPMIIGGAALMLWAYRRMPLTGTTAATEP